MTRNVLFSFVGETPQVVTETLYCLLKDPAKLKNGEIHLLTTRDMEYNALGLINEWINRFNDEYGTEWKPCMDANFAWENDEGGIQVIPIKDINSEGANKKAIDTITRIIYYWTSQDDVELYVSIAGGRKQLGSYMYQALSWFGQPNRTKLCHVIPKPELEGRRAPDGWIEGYFPKAGNGESAHERAINAPHGESVDFVEQPVIYLQHFLSGSFNRKKETSEDCQYKLTNFKNAYLDDEKPYQETNYFPFNKGTDLGRYLTFENIYDRFRFVQGASRNSFEQVNIIICPNINNNFVVEVNGLKKSISIDDRFLILFDFLYNLGDELYAVNNLVNNTTYQGILDHSLYLFLENTAPDFEDIDKIEDFKKLIKKISDIEWINLLLISSISSKSYELFVRIMDDSIKIIEEFINISINNRLEELNKKLSRSVNSQNIKDINNAKRGYEKDKNYYEEIKNSLVSIKYSIEKERTLITEEEIRKMNFGKIADKLTYVISDTRKEIDRGFLSSGLKFSILGYKSGRINFNKIEVTNPHLLNLKWSS